MGSRGGAMRGSMGGGRGECSKRGDIPVMHGVIKRNHAMRSGLVKTRSLKATFGTASPQPSPSGSSVR